ncbi:MAG: hypothetical protein JWM18_5145 [Chloroflexi bacterium]|nr:hypothetical protein [Chloroflexota bacterium]
MSTWAPGPDALVEIHGIHARRIARKLRYYRLLSNSVDPEAVERAPLESGHPGQRLPPQRCHHRGVHPVLCGDGISQASESCVPAVDPLN